jgi:hypothetical protein
MLTVAFHVTEHEVGSKTISPLAAALMALCTSAAEQLFAVRVAALASTPLKATKKPRTHPVVLDMLFTFPGYKTRAKTIPLCNLPTPTIT